MLCIGVFDLKADNRKFRGISKGSVDCYMKEISIAVEHFEGEIINIPAAFINSQNVDFLIGQEGFFDKFKIKFEKDHEMFELSLVSKK